MLDCETSVARGSLGKFDTNNTGIEDDALNLQSSSKRHASHSLQYFASQSHKSTSDTDLSRFICADFLKTNKVIISGATADIGQDTAQT